VLILSIVAYKKWLAQKNPGADLDFFLVASIVQSIPSPNDFQDGSPIRRFGTTLERQHGAFCGRATPPGCEEAHQLERFSQADSI
ncbi:MAG: hypothetical protein KDK30_00325, partial [Leptospiraceae bacterium]|nr:hypothetical protein [Leptospiraceae bacterium]